MPTLEHILYLALFKTWMDSTNEKIIDIDTNILVPRMYVHVLLFVHHSFGAFCSIRQYRQIKILVKNKFLQYTNGSII